MGLPQYEAGQAEAYISAKGWSYKRSGDQLVLACPLCGKAGKFYINNQTGLWDCKSGSCGQKGNFYLLQKSQGDVSEVKPLALQTPDKKRKSFPLSSIEKFETALAESDEALTYLASRGLSLETARAWHLGFKVDEHGTKHIVIPYLKGSNVVDVKYRLLPSCEDGRRPKYFRWGGESVLFGQQFMTEQAKKDGKTTLFLTEGEFDAITLWHHGFYPVLSTTTGAQSFRSDWFDAIAAFAPDKIVICYDSDVAGQNGAETLLKRFASFNTVNIVLPDVKDVNEYFTTHTRDEFDAIVQAAEPPEVDNVKSIPTVLNMLEEQLWMSTDAFDGLASQFSDINAMIEGGYWNGQLVVVSGPSGTGKTSFVLQEQLEWAKKDIASYLLCLEMPEIMMMRKIIQKEFGIPMLKLTQDHIVRLRPQLEKLPLFLGSRERKTADIEAICDTIRAAHARYGIKAVSFDNINYFVRSIDRTTQEIAKTTQALKDIAVELNIPIIAIAQPRKFDKDQRAMHAGDLKDSSAIEQDADTIIILHRQRIKSDIKDYAVKADKNTGAQQSHGGFLGNQSPYTLLRVEKARYSSGGETVLYFVGERSTYRVLTPEECEAMNRG